MGPVAQMGIMGAFVFASQMINFTIPGTGSSGHLGGGLLLAVVLGPWAGFLTMACVLLIQALFFADGGLLAWGANVFNLGFFTCFVAYPLIFKPITGNLQNRRRVFAASLLAATIGLQLGSLGVVLETVFSGISELPFKTFVSIMQPIHLAIGMVEGTVTAGVILFLAQKSQGLLTQKSAIYNGSYRIWATMAVATVAIGGALSWFASEKPDGLEWSIEKTSGQESIKTPQNATHERLGELQKATAFLPDYAFSQQIDVSAEKSLSGIVGGIFVFALTVAWALTLRLVRTWSKIRAYLKFQF
jgi:cobalt/nickel transport system permease protein